MIMMMMTMLAAAVVGVMSKHHRRHHHIKQIIIARNFNLPDSVACDCRIIHTPLSFHFDFFFVHFTRSGSKLLPAIECDLLIY